jgi:hypothetical protein
VNFLNLPAAAIGLRFLARIGIESIHNRVEALGSALIETLDTLRHLGAGEVAFHVLSGSQPVSVLCRRATSAAARLRSSERQGSAVSAMPQEPARARLEGDKRR